MRNFGYPEFSVGRIADRVFRFGISVESDDLRRSTGDFDCGKRARSGRIADAEHDRQIGIRRQSVRHQLFRFRRIAGVISDFNDFKFFIRSFDDFFPALSPIDARLRFVEIDKADFIALVRKAHRFFAAEPSAFDVVGTDKTFDNFRRLACAVECKYRHAVFIGRFHRRRRSARIVARKRDRFAAFGDEIVDVIRRNVSVQFAVEDDRIDALRLSFGFYTFFDQGIKNVLARTDDKPYLLLIAAA